MPVDVVNFLYKNPLHTAFVGLFLSSRHVFFAEVTTEGSEESAQQNHQEIMMMMTLQPTVQPPGTYQQGRGKFGKYQVSPEKFDKDHKQ